MNNKIKDFLAKTLFKALAPVNEVIRKDKRKILLYTNAGFRDNVQAVYDYMIKEGYNKYYKIIISADSLLPEELPKNVIGVSCMKGVLEYFTAGHVFYCQGKIPIYPSSQQYVVQMWHGTPFKGNNKRGDRNATTRSYYTHILSSSPYFEQIFIDNFFVGKQNVAICGQPRTDVMYDNNVLPPELQNYKKFVLWMPTYRMSSELGDEDVKQTSIIPIFDLKDLDDLQSMLEKLDVCLVIKLHPMQNLDLYSDMKYNNFFLLSSQVFQQKGWDLYRLLSKADALISDYSSVFYDFMLMDRPIGFAVDDIKEYEKNRGFVVDDPEYFMAGEKIKNKNDFYDFIKHVSDGIDLFKEQRNEVNRIVHTYLDNQNCKRALEIGGVYIRKNLKRRRTGL